MKTRIDFLNKMIGIGRAAALLLSTFFLPHTISIGHAGQCYHPLFSETVSTRCSETFKATASGMSNLYSSNTHPNRESAPKGIRLKSLNGVLAINGPRAPAELWLKCSNPGEANLTLTFPGFPMFIMNKEATGRVLSENQNVLEFSAIQGEDLFQLRIDNKNVLKQFARLLFQSGNQQFTVISNDQEGLEVRAEFEPLSVEQETTRIANHCSGLI